MVRPTDPIIDDLSQSYFSVLTKPTDIFLRLPLFQCTILKINFAQLYVVLRYPFNPKSSLISRASERKQDLKFYLYQLL